MDIGWRDTYPIHVSRKTADNVVAVYWAPMLYVHLIALLICLNIVGWGVYGLYELAVKL